MSHIDPDYENAKANFVKNGGDLSNVSVIQDDFGNMQFNFDGIDFIMTEDGDIYKGTLQ